MEIAVKPGQWGWSFDELTAAWRAAEEAGFARVSCFDHVTGGDRVAWDAVALLAAMAGATDRIGLAVHVVNVALRNPLMLAGQLAVAQASSYGRLEVGLGAGSGFAAVDHRAAGVPFPPFPARVARLEATCEALPRLWRGETVTDEVLGLHTASLGPTGIVPPPLIVGGDSDAVVEIAARHAAVWNGMGNDIAAFTRAAAHLRHVATRPVLAEAQVFVDGFAAGGGFAGLAEHLEALREAGADRAVLVLNEVRGDAAVARLAAAVLR